MEKISRESAREFAKSQIDKINEFLTISEIYLEKRYKGFLETTTWLNQIPEPKNVWEYRAYTIKVCYDQLKFVQRYL